MKISLIKTSIAIFMSALISYGIYNFAYLENNLFLTLASFIVLAITLIGAIGVDFKDKRNGVNMRLVSGIFFGVFLVINISFACFSFSTPLYIIINGIVGLIYALISHTIYRAMK